MTAVAAIGFFLLGAACGVFGVVAYCLFAIDSTIQDPYQ